MSDKAQFAEWRKLLNVTQGELGALLGLDARTIRRMEKGTTPIQKSHLVHLKMLFKQCWMPSSLHVLEEVLGKRAYLGREYRHTVDPKNHILVIRSTKVKKRVAVVKFNALAAIQYTEEHETTYDGLESVGGIYNKYKLLFEDKWPEKWRRHAAK